MNTKPDLLQMQRDQFRHDERNHHDISCLHKEDRLKHYGLHFGKYVGRLARGNDESKPVHRTIIDTFLVSLSAANVLHQDLSVAVSDCSSQWMANGSFLNFADAAGRFADACEKIDHLEDFTSIARTANADIVHWVLSQAMSESIDLPHLLAVRRAELAKRQFYIEG